MRTLLTKGSDGFLFAFAKPGVSTDKAGNLAVTFFETSPSGTDARLWVDDGAGGGTAGDLQVNGSEVRTVSTLASLFDPLSLSRDSNGLLGLAFLSNGGSGDELSYWIDDGLGGGIQGDSTVNGAELRVSSSYDSYRSPSLTLYGGDKFAISHSGEVDSGVSTADLLLTSGSYTAVSPEIAVSGNSTEIVAGDTTPDAADHTEYGTLDVDAGQLTRTFVIRNSGALDLTLGPDAGSISGPAAAEFSITKQPGEVVAPGGGLTTISVRFDPSVVGTRSATLSITNDDADESPYTFDLQGVGANHPDIEVSGNNVVITNGDRIPSIGDNTDYGKLAVGGGVLSTTFSVENLGAVADLTLGANAVSLSGSQSADFTVSTQPASSVAAGGATSFVIEFDASIVGPREALVTIANNDPDEAPFSFRIQGRGVNANDPGLGADAFLQGRYVQFALAANGALGSNNPVPVEGGPFGAYYPRPDANSTGTGDGTLAARSDRGRDGWTVGLPDVGVGGGSDGDFFLPGAREEGFCVTHDPAGDGSALTHWCNNRRDNRTDIPGQLEGTAHSQGSSSVDWNGAIANGSASGLQVEQTFRVDDYGSGLAVDVTLTNTTGADINDLYFMRNGDVDNNAPLTGLYWNTLQVFKQFPFDDEAIVFGTQADGSYAELRSSDPDARVSYGGFSNRDSYAVYNNSGPNLFQSGVFDQDWSISIAKYFPVIPQGESRSFSFGYGFIPAPPRVSLVHSGHGLFENNQEHVPESRHFKVRLSEIANEDVTVNLSYSGTAGVNDYSMSPGVNAVSSTQVVIPAGQLEAEMRIDQNDDTDVEGDEYIRVSINNAAGADIDEGEIDLVIFDDDGECGSDGNLYFSLESFSNTGAVSVIRQDLKSGTLAKRAIPAQISSFNPSNLRIAVDKSSQTLYVSDRVDNRWAVGDSSPPGVIVSFGFANNNSTVISNTLPVEDLHFDEVNQKLLYSWRDFDLNGGIYCVGHGDVITRSSVFRLHFAIDSENSRIYWAESYVFNVGGAISSADRVYLADYDASSCNYLGNRSQIEGNSGDFGSDGGLELDKANQRLYLLGHAGRLSSFDTDGSNYQSLTLSDLSNDFQRGLSLNQFSGRVLWNSANPSRLNTIDATFIEPKHIFKNSKLADLSLGADGEGCYTSNPGITVAQQTTSDTTPFLYGTVDGLDARVTVGIAGQIYAATNHGDGTWSLADDTISPGLAEGTYNVIATAESDSTSATDSTTEDLIIDAGAASPVPGIPDLLSDSGNDRTDNLTNRSGLEFAVSCFPGAKVELLLDQQVVDSSICEGLEALLSYSSPSDGRLRFKSRQTAGAQPSSDSIASLEVRLDTVPPGAAVFTGIDEDTNIIGDRVTSDASSIRLIGAVGGDAIELSGIARTIEFGPLLVFHAVPVEGQWSADLTGDSNPADLDDGTYSILLLQSFDAAGNTSNTFSSPMFTIDTTAPGAPTVSSLTTTDATPDVTGSYDNADNDYLTVTLNGLTYAQDIDPELTVGSGNWQLAVPVPLAVGTYDVSVTSRDLAGNISSDTSTDELQITSGGGIGFDGSACSGADSDGDGVPDECDNCIADKNPLQRDSNRDGLGDRCDATNLIPFSPAYVKWNTYIRQWNFLELIAQGANALEVKVTVLNLLGQELIQTLVNVPAGSEMDVDINQLLRTACTDNNAPNCSGFTDADGDGLIDSYGLVKVEFDNSDVSTRLVGRLTNYRPDPAGQPGVEGQSFSFALTRELRPPSRGATYALANTFDPQGLGYMVPNWLELIYLGVEDAPDSMGFTVNFYGQSGELVDSRRVELESLREQDSAAGHQLTNGDGKVKQAVYLVGVVPDDPEKEYLMSVTRYSSNAPAGVAAETYNYAVVAPGRAGAEGDLFTSISSQEYLCGRSQNWVEVANTAEEEVIGDIYFRNASGQIVGTSSVAMAAKSQSHFNATAMLPDDSIGSVQIASSKPGALLAQSMVYIHDCDRNGIQTAYAASARTLGRKQQAGTGNTFLGMENVLRLISTANLPVSPDFTLRTYLGELSAGKLPLNPFAAVDEQFSNNASYNFPSDRYGTIAVWSSEEGQFLAESLRVRRKIQDGLPRVDFLIPTEIK